jgi:hypothetical protein
MKKYIKINHVIKNPLFVYKIIPGKGLRQAVYRDLNQENSETTAVSNPRLRFPKCNSIMERTL